MRLSLGLFGLSLFLCVAPGHSFAKEKLLRQDHRRQQLDALTSLNRLASQLMEFANVCGRYPTSEEGLAFLIAPSFAPPVPQGWKKILDELPLDPWSNAIHYSSIESEDGVVIRITSFGPDGKPGTDDVEVSWSVPKTTVEDLTADLERQLKQIIEEGMGKQKEKENEKGTEEDGPEQD